MTKPKQLVRTDHDCIVSSAEADKICNTTPPTRKALEYAGEFPKFIPLKPGSRYGGYLLSELHAWIQRRIDASRVPEAPERTHFAGPGRPRKTEQKKPVPKKKIPKPKPGRPRKYPALESAEA